MTDNFSSYTDLSEVSLDDIQTNLMQILYTYEGVIFNHFSLYEKLLDKYDKKFINLVNQSFKAKYFVVLRNLMLKYDNITIKKNDNIYSIVCAEKNEVTVEYENNKTIFEDTNSPTFDLPKHIIENNMTDEFKFVDPFDGNTIYHDVVISENYDLVKKLIDSNSFNFDAVNKKNQTPLELSNSLQISNLIIKSMYNKLLIESLKMKLELVEIKDELNNKNKIIEDTNILKYIKIKTGKFYKDNKIIIWSSVLLFIIYKFVA